MKNNLYLIPSLKVIEITVEGVLCLSTQIPGENENYEEKEFEW